MKLIVGSHVLLHVKSAMTQRSTGIVLYQYSINTERYSYGDLRALEAIIDRIRREHTHVRQEGELPSTP